LAVTATFGSPTVIIIAPQLLRAYVELKLT
jgi:hypothetical protein